MTRRASALDMLLRPGGMNRKGFTLIELLIVVVIIGILAAIAIPKFANTNTSKSCGIYIGTVTPTAPATASSPEGAPVCQ